MDTFDLNDERPAIVPAYDPAKCLERLGKLTASKAHVVMGDLKASQCDTYVKSLAWERVYGARDAEYCNAAMERGNDLEPAALDWYAEHAERRGLGLMRTPGFMVHDHIPYVGASPDAIALRNGNPSFTVQVKCPLHGAWMETKRTLLVPSAYRWQCRWEMWVAGMPTCDFVAWHPVAGGLIVGMNSAPDEFEQMAERAEIVNAMVQRWVDILEDRKEIAA